MREARERAATIPGLHLAGAAFDGPGVAGVLTAAEALAASIAA